MDPNAPDIEIPVIPLVLDLAQRGRLDLAREMLTRAFVRHFANSEWVDGQ